MSYAPTPTPTPPTPIRYAARSVGDVEAALGVVGPVLLFAFALAAVVAVRTWT